MRRFGKYFLIWSCIGAVAGVLLCVLLHVVACRWWGDDWLFTMIEIAVFAGVGALWFGFKGAIRSCREQGVVDHLEDLARRLDFHYVRHVHRAELGALLDLPVVNNCDGASHRMTSRGDGLPVEMMDVQTTVKIQSSEGNSSECTLSRTIVVCAYAGPVRFHLYPANVFTRLRTLLQCGNHVMLSAAPDSRGHEDAGRFMSRYFLQLRDDAWTDEDGVLQLSTDVESAVNAVFTPPVVAALSDEPGWTVQAANGCVALWREDRLLNVEERPELLVDALRIHELLTPRTTASTARWRIAVTPPENLSIAFRRYLIIMAGGIAGCLLGFFVAIVLLRPLVNLLPPFLGFCLDSLLALAGLAAGIAAGVRRVKSHHPIFRAQSPIE